MYKPKMQKKRLLEVNNTYEAEGLEQKLRRMTENKEPITDEVETVFTNKKDGVMPAFDIRTDRWEVAQEAMGKVYQAELDDYLKSQQQPVTEEPKPGNEG